MLINIAIFVGMALCFGAVRLLFAKRSVKPLGAPVMLLSKRCRRQETISSGAGFCVWTGLFVYCAVTGEGLAAGTELSYLYVIIMGFMAGLSLSSMSVTALIPTGLYEKGILTETRAVKYQDVTGYSVTAVPKREIKKLDFIPVQNRDKRLSLIVANDEAKGLLRELKARGVYMQ